MKKILQLLLFFVFSIKSFAQMDTEHWFAPMFDSLGQSSYIGDYLYLSTDSNDGFEVIVYSGETIIDKATIKKGSPAKITIPKGVVTTNDVNMTFSKSAMGLRVVGDYKFFANLRLLRVNHAEIINSKGTAGLGKLFYASMAPIFDSAPYFNSQICIIATENNTKIKFSEYNQNISFINGYPFQSEVNVTLNKGESYIVATRCDTSVDPGENEYGLIGTKIESDKPISVSNGNFNASYVTSVANNDILMDQSVPVERLGKEHILAKGNGDIAYGMERALIVATKDNTDIFINGSFVRKINKGEYEWVDGNAYYIDQGSDIYDMFIRTSENVYVYQFLAGDRDYLYGRASGGMNLIPSLNCFLPNQIVELPAINEIGSDNSFSTKINIISQTGAKINLNGEILAPHPVPGNSAWQLFTKSGVTGNVSIYSDKAVTAGIASGNKAVGFGGYFAGFNSIPVISKSGDCTKGQKLKVDDGYDYYEWSFNGRVVLSGNKAFVLDPALYGKGYYHCKVTKFGCDEITTVDFGYLECPSLDSKQYTIGNCGFVLIPVQFSSDPSMLVKTSSINIIQNAVGVSVYVDAFGKYFIRYDANGTDQTMVTFKYYFENQDSLPDSEEVTVTVNIAQINLTNMEGVECVDFDGKGIYDLKDIFEKTVNQDSTYDRYEYFEDSALAQKIPDSEVSYYRSEPDRTVYVKVTNSYGCDNSSKPAEIALKTFELPVINTIDVKGESTVTINVSKGRQDYGFYILKNGPLTYLPAGSDYDYTTNTLPIKDGKGTYTVYVKSADDCNPVAQTFVVIGISNVITPNDDGKNDVIDMSMLFSKINPKFQVFDRNGRLIFEGSVANDFKWTGKDKGVSLSTGTYWYILQWQDYDGAEPDVMTGWILLKSRN